MIENPKFLSRITATIWDENHKMSLKALIFLVNVSSDSNVAISLHEKGILSILLEVIFQIMKGLKNAHLKIEKSLLSKDTHKQDEFDIYTINND